MFTIFKLIFVLLFALLLGFFSIPLFIARKVLDVILMPLVFGIKKYVRQL